MEASSHTGLGVASFAVSIASAVLIFLLFVIGGLLEASTPGGIGEDSPVAMVVGLCLFVFLATTLVGLGLGIAGLVQRGRKLYAILGTVFAAATLACTIFVVLIGLAMS